MPVGSITLGGVDLNPSMQWTDRWRYVNMAQEKTTTLGGSLVVRSARLYEGTPVTLEATTETGWITKTTLDSILGLAAGLNSTYTLDFHGTVMTVMFDNANPPPVDMRAFLFKQVPDTTDYFYGTIKLFTV